VDFLLQINSQFSVSSDDHICTNTFPCRHIAIRIFYIKISRVINDFVFSQINSSIGEFGLKICPKIVVERKIRMTNNFSYEVFETTKVTKARINLLWLLCLYLNEKPAKNIPQVLLKI
jgi:hypothetical protein